MALFDKEPEIAKNSFTAKDAGEVFREAAEKLDDASVPAEVTEMLLEIAKVVVRVGIIFAA
jgi:hypothetical protein